MKTSKERFEMEYFGQKLEVSVTHEAGSTYFNIQWPDRSHDRLFMNADGEWKSRVQMPVQKIQELGNLIKQKSMMNIQ